MRLPMVLSPRDVIALVDRGGETLERVLSALPRIVPLLDRVDALVDDIGRLVARMEATRLTAEGVLSRVEAPLERLTAIADALEPVTALRPTLQRLAERTDPEDAESVVRLIDRMPNVVERFERDVMPVIDAMRTLAPDMHDLLEASLELNELLVKVPGMGRIKKKLDEVSDSAE